MQTSNKGIRDWRLRPEIPVLACGNNTLQFGLDRRWAMRLSELSAKEMRWLETSAKKQHRLRRTAENHGVSESRAIQICATLARSGLLVPPPPDAPTAQIMLGAVTKHAAGGTSDLPTLSALRPDGQGQTTLDRRALSRVAITNSGRLGAQIALLLAAAGVGNLQLPDRELVTDDDLGPFPAAAIGRARPAVLKRLFKEMGVTVDTSFTGTPDLTVSVETGTQSAAYFGTLHQMAVPYLAVAVGEAEVEVGPLVLPDRSACTHCLQLRRAAADEHWAEMLPGISALPPRPVETILASAAAAFTAAQALTFLDGGRPSLVNGLATIALPEALPEVVTVFPNPNCGCTSIPPAEPTA